MKKNKARKVLKVLKEIELEIANKTEIGEKMLEFEKKNFLNVEKPNETHINSYIEFYRGLKNGNKNI